MAILSRLLPIAAASYGLQGIAGLIFVPQANEKYFDLAGSIGFLTSTVVSIYYPTLKERYWYGNTAATLTPLAPRQLLLNAAIGGWAVRLGAYLFWRALKHGGDSRFDDIKNDPKKFAPFWAGQATWVFAVGLPIYMVNSLAPSAVKPLGTIDYLSIALFAGSWIFELAADYQKTQWRKAKDRKEHDEKFISSGLWNISRHPNYVGEVGLWVGIWALSIPALRTPVAPPYTWLLAGVSPLITWLLLTKVSGVPPMEKANEKKFKDDPKWEQYKRTVPVFWPWGSVNA